METIGSTHFTFKIVDSQELLEESFRLRYQVYCHECNFIHEADYPQRRESDEYDKVSLHVVAMDPYGIIGAARLILYSPLGFPLEKHCPDITADDALLQKEHAAEISRLVISKNYRRRKDDGLYYGPHIIDRPDQKITHPGGRRERPMAFGIYREMYQESKRKGITHWYALMEEKLWRLLHVHGFTFKPIGEAIDYYGPVVPYLAKIDELERELFKRSVSFFEYFIDGLEQTYVPPFYLATKQ
ncbi:MAG: PEP-CTERM/exosortase system-associated acyltransferase [Candidatus Omnitrophica bacterium]|nr:PEP-CTERM/exosortase system-associated acyltransferase [Candidatus Omnitrophota bacterium]